MKILKKIMIIILLFYIIMNLSISNTYATTITKEALQESINGYLKGDKTAYANVILNDGAIKNNVTIEGGCDNTVAEVTDDAINIVGDEITSKLNYIVSQKDNSILIYSTNDIGLNEEYASYTKKLFIQYIVNNILFVSVTDLYKMDSNKSLKYFVENEMLNQSDQVQNIPEDVDIKNGLDYFKWAYSNGVFPPARVDNSVYSLYYDILENNDSQFKYTTNLKINLSNLKDIEGNKEEQVNSEENKNENKVSSNTISNNVSNNTINNTSTNQNTSKVNNTKNDTNIIFSNINNKDDNKQISTTNVRKSNDITTSYNNLPKTGKNSMLFIAVFLCIALIVMVYVKIKKYEDIP